MRTWRAEHVVEGVLVAPIVVARRVVDAGIVVRDGAAKAVHAALERLYPMDDHGAALLAAVEEELEVFEPLGVPAASQVGASPDGVDSPPLSGPSSGPLREESIWWRLGSGGPW